MTDPKLRPGTNHCKCSVCLDYFTTVRNFDSHRHGNAQNRRCVDLGALLRKDGSVRYRRNGPGLWAKATNPNDVPGFLAKPEKHYKEV